MLKYVKTAFLYHWNLLAVAAGAGVALLTPDLGQVLWPLLAAGELTYLTLLSTNEKFQKSVLAQEAKASRAQSEVGAEQQMKQLLKALPPEHYRRFGALQERCVQLRQLAQQLQPNPRDGVPLEGAQLAGLDRLLWFYLRALYTEQALTRFLDATDAQQVEKEIRFLESQQTALGDIQGNAVKEKAHKTLEDNLATCRQRLDNLRRAADNQQLVRMEIHRLENKIQTLSELAINRQEPEYLSEQVDQVARSMLETEKTMRELSFATGLETLDDAVPPMLQKQVLQQ